MDAAQRPATVAKWLAIAAGGALLLGGALCAVAPPGASGWPSSTGWTGFLLLLLGAFTLTVAALTLVLGMLAARASMGTVVVLAAVGLAGVVIAFVKPMLAWFGIVGAALVVAAAFTGLQAWLWRRAERAP